MKKIMINRGKHIMEILKMINQKEKELHILIMVIDMKVIGKMINLKGKEYCIIIMVIEKWEIIQMVKR